MMPLQPRRDEIGGFAVDSALSGFPQIVLQSTAFAATGRMPRKWPLEARNRWTL
jgi:hypothetical protein